MPAIIVAHRFADQQDVVDVASAGADDVEITLVLDALLGAQGGDGLADTSVVLTRGGVSLS